MTVDTLRQAFPAARLTPLPGNTEVLFLGGNAAFPSELDKEVELRPGRRIVGYGSADGTVFPGPLTLANRKEGWPQAFAALFKQLADERLANLRRAQSANAESTLLALNEQLPTLKKAMDTKLGEFRETEESILLRLLDK